MQKRMMLMPMVAVVIGAQQVDIEKSCTVDLRTYDTRGDRRYRMRSPGIVHA